MRKVHKQDLAFISMGTKQEVISRRLCYALREWSIANASSQETSKQY